MTLNQLRYFCAAANYHSITKAAQSLYVTQPTISIAIRDLEKEFSIPLFTYTKNRLELTQEGEEFYQKASSLLHQSQEMQAYFNDKEKFSTSITIGFPPMLSLVFFPELIDAFHEEYPDIFLNLKEYGSVRCGDLVQDGVLDLGIVNADAYNVDKFNYHKLSDEELLFTIHPSHPLFDREVVNVHDLTNEPLIMFNSDSVQNNLVHLRFAAENASPRVIMYCSQVVTNMKFLRRGDCGCFYYSSILPHLPEVRGIPLNPALGASIGLIWKKGKYVSREVQCFINFCKKYYKDGILPTNTQ